VRVRPPRARSPTPGGVIDRGYGPGALPFAWTDFSSFFLTPMPRHAERIVEQGIK
jgi:hypothetical protein